MVGSARNLKLNEMAWAAPRAFASDKVSPNGWTSYILPATTPAMTANLPSGRNVA